MGGWNNLRPTGLHKELFICWWTMLFVLLLLFCLLRYNLHIKIFIINVKFNKFSTLAKLYNHKPLLFHNAVSFPYVWHPVFDCIEAYAPGFKGSVVGRDILTPPDLERVFGLPGGVSSYRMGGFHHTLPSFSLHLHSLTCPLGFILALHTQP